MHLTLTASSEAVVDELLVDLAKAVEDSRGVTAGDPALLDAVRDLDPDSLGDDVLGTLLPLAGIGPGEGLPERMAAINALLEQMPMRLRERILVEFLGQLFTPDAE
jgi:hypothetical protein